MDVLAGLIVGAMVALVLIGAFFVARQKKLGHSLPPTSSSTGQFDSPRSATTERPLPGERAPTQPPRLRHPALMVAAVVVIFGAIPLVLLRAVGDRTPYPRLQTTPGAAGERGSDLADPGTETLSDESTLLPWDRRQDIANAKVILDDLARDVGEARRRFEQEGRDPAPVDAAHLQVEEARAALEGTIEAAPTDWTPHKERLDVLVDKAQVAVAELNETTEQLP